LLVTHEDFSAHDGGIDLATIEAKDHVPGQIVDAKRRGGVVIDKNDIGGSAGAELAQGAVEELAGEGGIVGGGKVDELVGGQGAGIVAGGFVQQIGHPHLFQHVVGKAIIAQNQFHIPPQHGGHVRHAHGVVHVGTGLMADPGAGFAQQGHLPGIDVDGVDDDAVRAQDAVLGQTIDGAQAVGSQ